MAPVLPISADKRISQHTDTKESKSKLHLNTELQTRSENRNI